MRAVSRSRALLSTRGCDTDAPAAGLPVKVMWVGACVCDETHGNESSARAKTESCCCTEIPWACKGLETPTLPEPRVLTVAGFRVLPCALFAGWKTPSKDFAELPVHVGGAERWRCDVIFRRMEDSGGGGAYLERGAQRGVAGGGCRRQQRRHDLACLDARAPHRGDVRSSQTSRVPSAQGVSRRADLDADLVMVN